LRRRRLVRRIVAAIAVFLAAWAFWWEPRRLVTRTVVLEVPSWTAPPLRIAIVSDLHAGSPYVKETKVRAVVDAVNAGKPDVIALLGDYVVQGVLGGRFVPPETTAGILRSLHAPLGVYAVLGNHDWWLNGSRVEKALHDAGIEVVEDRAVRAGSFWIAGISDFWEGKHDIARALAAINDDAPVIAITHNPDLFPMIPQRVALTLAGHTHGGQVALPIVGRLIVPSRYGSRYAIGHIIESGRHLYVTAGVGTSIIPVRFRVPPEVVFIELRSARR
jgi:predicted MPP superfamily phosphohydrolase